MRTYGVCAVDDGARGPDDRLRVVAAELDDDGRVRAVAEAAPVELEVLAVVEEPLGEEHLGVDERGVVLSDEMAEREVALVDHRCRDARQIECGC